MHGMPCLLSRVHVVTPALETTMELELHHSFNKLSLLSRLRAVLLKKKEEQRERWNQPHKRTQKTQHQSVKKKQKQTYKNQKSGRRKKMTSQNEHNQHVPAEVAPTIGWTTQQHTCVADGTSPIACSFYDVLPLTLRASARQRPHTTCSWRDAGACSNHGCGSWIAGRTLPGLSLSLLFSSEQHGTTV